MENEMIDYKGKKKELVFYIYIYTHTHENHIKTKRIFDFFLKK
jgi:hypothetical protein